jgi:hypothetical protein
MVAIPVVGAALAAGPPLIASAVAEATSAELKLAAPVPWVGRWNLIRRMSGGDDGT